MSTGTDGTNDNRGEASSVKIREWLIAVAAVIAAGGTVAAVWYTVVYRHQDQQAALAAQQRAQADQVSAWPYATSPAGLAINGPPGRQRWTYIELINTSGQPVYQAVVNLVIVQGAGPQTGRQQFAFFQSVHRPNPFYRTLAVIPPGTSWTYMYGDWTGGFRMPGAEVAFTDQGGRTWVRSASGALTRIGEPAANYYDVPLPAEWATPQPNRPVVGSKPPSLCC